MQGHNAIKQNTITFNKHDIHVRMCTSSAVWVKTVKNNVEMMLLMIICVWHIHVHVALVTVSFLDKITAADTTDSWEELGSSPKTGRSMVMMVHDYKGRSAIKLLKQSMLSRSTIHQLCSNIQKLLSLPRLNSTPFTQSQQWLHSQPLTPFRITGTYGQHNYNWVLLFFMHVVLILSVGDCNHG